jgi:hypothetical protein
MTLADFADTTIFGYRSVPSDAAARFAWRDWLDVVALIVRNGSRRSRFWLALSFIENYARFRNDS